MAEVSDAYCFWTNKGGVGKSTMAFHSSTAYAKTHPDEQVIAVDCDPQANLSTTMLTQLENNYNARVHKERREGSEVLREKENNLLEGKFPQTLLGLLMARYLEQKELDPSSLLVNASDHNSNLPPNMKLLCGDRRLPCITGEILKFSDALGLDMPPWIKERTHLKRFLVAAAIKAGRKTVVFIDTNPFMTVFTEIALLTANKVVVPTLADDYCTDALRNMVYILHGVGRSPMPSVALYEESMFWAKLRHNKGKMLEIGYDLPRIHTVIFNKCKVRHSYITQAQHSIFELQSDTLLTLIDEVRRCPDVDVRDVFNLNGKPLPTTREEAGRMLGAHMTDLLSAGIICMRCGLPLWMLRRNRVEAAQEMDMTHAAVSESCSKSIVQLIGRPRQIEAWDLNDEPLTSVLHSLTRGRRLISLARIQETLDDERKDAEKAFGAKRPRTASPK